METDAKYKQMGIFVLLFFTAFCGFLIWMAKIDFNENKHIYHINFTGSVTGLRVGESVRFHGIPIGAVKKISPCADQPEIVQVRVTIDHPHLIRQDSVATIEAQGLTGLSYIQIEGGSQSSATLTKIRDEKYPIIASRPSKIEEFLKSAPYILSSIHHITDRLNQTLSQNTLEHFARTIENLSAITTDLSGGPNSLKNTLNDLQQTLKTVDATAANVNKQVQPLSQEMQLTLQSIQSLSRTLQPVAQNLKIFTSDQQNSSLAESLTDGLSDFQNLMTKSTAAMTRLNLMLQEIEQSPFHFLKKSTEKGYHLP